MRVKVTVRNVPFSTRPTIELDVADEGVGPANVRDGLKTAGAVAAMLVDAVAKLRPPTKFTQISTEELRAELDAREADIVQVEVEVEEDTS